MGYNGKAPRVRYRDFAPEPTSDDVASMTHEQFKRWCLGQDWRPTYAEKRTIDAERQARADADASQRAVVDKLNDLLDEDGRHPVAVDRLAREVGMTEGYVRLILAGLHGSGRVICSSESDNTLYPWIEGANEIAYATLCREPW